MSHWYVLLRHTCRRIIWNCPNDTCPNGREMIFAEPPLKEADVYVSEVSAWNIFSSNLKWKMEAWEQVALKSLLDTVSRIKKINSIYDIN